MATTARVGIRLDDPLSAARIGTGDLVSALLACGADQGSARPTVSTTPEGLVVTFAFRRQSRFSDELIAQRIAADAIAKVYRGLISMQVTTGVRNDGSTIDA